MRVECPECGARIHVAELPENNARLRCLKCGIKFRPPEPDDEDDEDYEDEPRRGKGRKTAARRRDDDDEDDDEEVEKKFPVGAVVGGSVAVVAVVGIIIGVVFATKSDAKKEEAVQAKVEEPKPGVVQPVPGGGPPVRPANPIPPQKSNAPPVSTPTTPTKPSGGTPTGRPGFNPQPSRPTSAILTGPHAELFRMPLDVVAPPKIRAASLNPTDADKEPEVPTFHSLMMARKTSKNPTTTPTVPKGAKLTIEEIKKACVFITVDAGTRSSSGSGFLIASNGATGFIATNHHVIKAATASKFGSSAAKVAVIFNSGLPDEHKYKAEIVAYDAEADLAILKIKSGLPWPKPLSPYNTPTAKEVTEGLAIQFWGFPLGSILASGNKNPEITLGTGTVAGFQHAVSGKLHRIKIGGTMNPGNSGGPIVSNDGRLVGIAVAIIKPTLGTGIGFAVPVDDLIALLEGKLLTTLFIPTGLENGNAKFLAVAPIMDPLDRVDTVFIRRWAGIGRPPEIVKDPFTGHKPFAMRKDGKANLPGVEEFPLKKYSIDKEAITGLGLALGEMTVPLDSAQVLIQVASQTTANKQGTRLTSASKPVSYTLSVADMPTGSDAHPFSELTANPDRLAGQVIVVRGKIMAPPVTREPIQDLIIADTDNQVPARMKFLVNREHAAQFDEVDIEHQSLPVRLVCLVGQRGSDGILPVRVARVDFLGRGKRIVHTIPEKPAAGDDLAGLNRAPQSFAGKTIVVKASTVPITAETKNVNELMVIFPNQSTPRNLAFTISASMKERLKQELGGDRAMNAIIPSRLTIRVPANLAATDARAKIPVAKIEFLDEDGKPILAVERAGCARRPYSDGGGVREPGSECPTAAALSQLGAFMQGIPQILDALNRALTIELTAINQYFCQSRMCKNWGFMKLAAKHYEESIGEMKHADKIIERVLFLDGVPEIARYDVIRVGADVKEQLENDLKLETGGVAAYNELVNLAIQLKDNGTHALALEILQDSEEHVDWLETQLNLIQSVGLERYLAENM